MTLRQYCLITFGAHSILTILQTKIVCGAISYRSGQTWVVYFFAARCHYYESTISEGWQKQAEILLCSTQLMLAAVAVAVSARLLLLLL